MIEPGAFVLDVGCDHGYLCIYLIREKIASFAMGTDIAEGSIEKAKKNIERFGVSDRVETMLCDGFRGLDLTRFDTIVIAGLGGEMIGALLKPALKALTGKTLLLSPMRREERFRAFCYENGIEIEKEVLCKDERRVHTVMKARRIKGKKAADYDADALYFGKIDPLDPLLPEYVDARSRYLKKVIEHADENPRRKEKKELELAAAALAKMLTLRKEDHS